MHEDPSRREPLERSWLFLYLIFRASGRLPEQNPSPPVDRCSLQSLVSFSLSLASINAALGDRFVNWLVTMTLFAILTAWRLAITAVLIPIAYRVYRAAKDPYRDIPGPFLARFTRLWFLRGMLKLDWEKTNIALHRKYGKLSSLWLTIADDQRVGA